MNYSFNSRVRYSETGENGKLTLPGVLNYFQDCCTFHAESVGLGGDVLKARDRAWVFLAGDSGGISCYGNGNQDHDSTL